MMAAWSCTASRNPSSGAATAGDSSDDAAVPDFGNEAGAFPPFYVDAADPSSSPNYLEAGPDVGITLSFPPGSPPDLALARCKDPNHGPRVDFTDEASLSKLLVGRWMPCHPLDFFGNGGILFNADGTWNRVDFDAQGTPFVGVGALAQGRWGLVPGTQQVNFYLSTGGENGWDLVFETAPVRFDVFNTQVVPL